MKYFRKQFGFTLVELLTVIAITVILIGIVAGVASRIDTQNKERQLRGIFSLLNIALQEFEEYGYQYDLRYLTDQDMIYFYNSLDYPPDCNDLPPISSNPQNPGLDYVLESVLGAELNIGINQATYKVEYSGSLALYFFLNRVPTSRETVGKINPQFLTDEDESGNKMFVSIGIGQQARNYPLMRILDPWGNTLRYHYYISYQDFRRISAGGLNEYYEFLTENKESVPILISAGPDGEWWTGDEITSR